MRLNLKPYRIYVSGFMAIVGSPVLIIGFPAYFWFVDKSPDPQNLKLFFGGIGLMVGVLVLVMYGPNFHALWRKRLRFRELTSGAKKSDFLRNIQELDEIARTLGGSYPRRLREMREGQKRK
ncbi:MAG: DUF3198 domain-containing protein [Euryarchaeota archaeon]|nr:DUF3198 domain-containing protein [Euryarchaeota archaeon]